MNKFNTILKKIQYNSLQNQSIKNIIDLKNKKP